MHKVYRDMSILQWANVLYSKHGTTFSLLRRHNRLC
jgi:hypothetical protein